VTIFFPVIRHEPYRKWRIQQFFYCCVCIRCSGNVFTGPLRGNNRGIHRLSGGIYSVRHWDGLRCHDIRTKLRKEWFSHSEFNWGGHLQTHSILIFLL
jgi:hypothetical protein